MYRDILNIQRCFEVYKDVDVAFNFACPYIAELMNADRVVLNRSNFDPVAGSTYLKKETEWCAPGVSEFYSGEIGNLKIYLTEAFDLYAKTFAQGDPLCISEERDIDIMPEQLKNHFYEKEVKSLITYPILVNNVLWGTIGIQDIRGKRDFIKNEDIDKMGIIAHIISSFIVTKEIHKESIVVDSDSIRMQNLGKLASSIAHEVNNPIFIIGGYAARILQLAKENEYGEEISSSAHIIQNNCKKATNIIEGLRLLSRNARNDANEVICVNDVIKRCADICIDGYQLAGINLRVDLCEEESLIEGSATLLSQVVTNLLNNASDAIEKNEGEKWIQIETEVNSNEVLLRVTDCGPRLSTDLIKNIMEPFFTTKRLGKGTGLGLSICNEIVKRFRGRLYIDDKNDNFSIVAQLPKVEFEEGEDDS